MKVVTPEGYTFVTKFQEDNSHKVLRSVNFFSIKFDEIFFDTVCWAFSPIGYLDWKRDRAYNQRVIVTPANQRVIVTLARHI